MKHLASAREHEKAHARVPPSILDTLPPRCRMRGGDLPRGGNPCGLGHAGRMRQPNGTMLFYVLLFCLIQLVGCLVVSPTRVALAENKHIRKSDEREGIYGANASGVHLTDLDETPYFLDDEGNRYKCLDYSKYFVEGTFTEKNIYDHFSARTVERCALAVYWAQQNARDGKGEILGQVFIWKIMREEGYFHGANTVDFGVQNYDDTGDYQQFLAWYDQNHNKYDCHGTYWANGDTQAVGRLWVTPKPGRVKLKKVSADPSVTNDNDYFSLAGATYGIWTDAACTQSLGVAYDLTTDATGTSNMVELEPGTYWVREKSAPSGYELSTSVYEVRVGAIETTTLEVSDEPIRVGKAFARKVSAEPAITDGNELYSLGGARYGIWRDEACTQELGSEYDLVTNENGETNTVELEMGTYWVREKSAPAWYKLDTSVHKLVVRAGRTTELALADVPRTVGYCYLLKTSRNTSITGGNACYALGGARYGIWHDQACTQRLGSEYDLITDATGKSNTVEIEMGTYWVREIEVPKGYALDDTAHKVVVRPTQTTRLMLSDEPLSEGPLVWATKVDANTGGAQGNATLADAEFMVRYYDGIYELSNLPSQPKRSWRVRGDANGNLVASNAAKVSGDAFYQDSAGAIVLPVGTVTVQEVKAPEGYLLEGQSWQSPPNYAAPEHVMHTTGEAGYQTPIIPNEVYRGGIRLLKVDAERQLAYAQGDATLEGAEFSIVLTSGNPVFVNGATFQPGDVVARIRTNVVGVAATDDHVLPYGSYIVKESQAPLGYLHNENYEAAFTISADGQVINLGGNPCEDYVICGGIVVGKVSRETAAHRPQGEASLAGAVFSVTLESNQPVVVDGTLYQQGDMVCSIVTNEDGIASTDDHALPYGTYTMREMTPPVGFLPNETWQQSVQIREDGMLYDFGNEDASVGDQVKRGGFHLNKVDGESMERLALVAFRITSLTTDESHVLITDENGILDTEMEPHTSNTNANDDCLDDDGRVVEEHLTAHAGIWFSGGADFVTEPDDQRGALPYDTYRIEELPSDVNDGLRLVSFTVRIHKDEQFLDMGTVDDKRIGTPSIYTTLTFNGSQHVAPVSERVTLTDTVSYTNLEPGIEYTLIGSLMSKDDGTPLCDAEDNPLTQTTTFVPNNGSGTVPVRFEIDTRFLAGVSVVAFERLERDGAVVCTHADLEDEGQTVTFPGIGTTLEDDDGNKEVAQQETIRLVDHVAYHNLEPGMSYELAGVLMDKDQGEPVLDATGNEIRATTVFVADEPSGTTEVPFVFDTSAVVGKTLVAYENLSRSGLLLAAHADLDNLEQTITLPTIQTTLTDTQDQHILMPHDTIELQDSVTYAGLEVGKTYEIVGTLVDKLSGDPIVGTDGNPIQARKELTPVSPDGVVQISFEVDSTLVAGRAIVAFESLEHEGRQIAVHADVNDERQSVYLPSIGTTLVDDNGLDEVPAQEGVLLTDIVAYRGLRPGDTYLVVGTLRNRDTGEPLQDRQGEPIVSEKRFVPTTQDGEVGVSFVVDTTGLGNTTIVATEQLLHVTGEGDSEDTRLIALHEDLQDEGQTVKIPHIATTATDALDGDKYVPSTGTIRIHDEVSYTNLEPGTPYAMTGTLYDKQTQELLLNQDETPVTATVEFTPTQPDGTVELTFEVEANRLSAKEIVAFETCASDGHAVALHANLQDQSQTVYVSRIGTKAARHDKGLVDTVSYEQLNPELTYELRGTLIDKETGKPVTDKDGHDIAAHTTFKPEKTFGTIELPFSFDKELVAGRDVVVFERLYEKETLVAAHEDLEDAAQTVSFEKPSETPKQTSQQSNEEKQKTETKTQQSAKEEKVEGSKRSPTPVTGDGLANPALVALVGLLILFAALSGRHRP